jgi:hypothetical protein
VMQRGDAKPFLLEYHPKALIGNVPADKALLGEAKVPVELTRLRLRPTRRVATWFNKMAPVDL